MPLRISGKEGDDFDSSTNLTWIQLAMSLEKLEVVITYLYKNGQPEFYSCFLISHMEVAGFIRGSFFFFHKLHHGRMHVLDFRSELICFVDQL